MKIKKAVVMILTLAMMLSMLGLTAFAADDSAKINVTIVDKTGAVVLAQEPITVTDTDKDGKLTIDDALYLAHEGKFTGGAAKGYATKTGEYGLSITKLWGTENGSGFGYYLNNKSAMSLTDTVKTGDFLTAFLYTDTTNFSDTYTYFDVNTVKATAGEEIKLTLSAAAFDSNFKPIVKPVAGAVITVNGTATTYKTDAEGKVTIKIDKTGTCVISATSSAMRIIAPVCTATVSAADTASASATSEVSGVTLPNTGSCINPVIYAVVAFAMIAGIVVAAIPKKVNEK
ncbi:MAG TPA: hypothetical protein PK854_01900 [Oscillospiraceae bacterium]|nr:hypothetical protein [Oscillospiraceae bacterium]HPS34002.1 hypothetical protein [Oscillospiraceae bacterium]